MVLRLILPVVVLVCVAAVLPRGLARLLGRRPLALMLNGGLSALVLVALTAGYFFGLYIAREPRVLAAAAAQPWAAFGHFAGLGVIAGLIWGPVLLVSLMLPWRRQ